MAASVKTGLSDKLGSIWWAFLLRGLFAIALGVFALFWPGVSLSALLVLLGAAALVAGIGQILTARRLPADDAERAVIVTIGIAAAVIGLVLAFWPGSGVAVISWVIGIAAILIGAFFLYLGSRFKRLETRLGTPGNRSLHFGNEAPISGHSRRPFFDERPQQPVGFEELGRGRLSSRLSAAGGAHASQVALTLHQR